jgi:hypothetical protein
MGGTIELEASWTGGPAFQPGPIDTKLNPAVNFTLNSIWKSENIFLYLLIHKIRLYLWTLRGILYQHG